jgi:15-cis-phytoene desaturase
MKDTDVLIVGAGLAGLSCAIRLLEKGKRVIVLEARDVVGGRTSSWNDNGMYVESGMHRFLGFYEHLPGLLLKADIHLDDIVAWEDELEIKMPDGKPCAVFALAPLFKPIKTLSKLIMNNAFLSPLEKASLTKFFTAGYATLAKNKKDLDKKTVASFAVENGVSSETIQKILVPFTEGLFFLSPEKYSAYYFFALFAPYLTKLHKSRVGAFKGGMTEVMTSPLAMYVKNLGGNIEVSKPVSQLLTEKDSVIGVKAGDGAYYAAHVVLATSLNSAQKLISRSFGSHKSFADMLSLPSMPSVTFQISMTEPSMHIDRTTFSPGTVLSSYAEQSRTTFSKEDGRISIILASPEKYLEVSPKQILEDVLKDAKRLNLHISKRSIKDFRKVVWKNDFYSYERGAYEKVPEQQTKIRNLILAGDYTKQQYLQTMEGAVYAGALAAEIILSN